MARLLDQPVVQKILGVVMRLLFVGGHILLFPILLVVEKFVPRKKRMLFWRQSGKILNHFIFSLLGLKLHKIGEFPDPKNGPYIYASNHPTIIDGFFYYSILGPNLIGLSAPAKMQIFPFNVWFPRMGVIDVIRDDYDALKIENNTSGHMAVDGHTAVRKLTAALVEENTSVLIFPEGHAEPGHEMHNIHTGAARVAIKSQRPIVPMALTNMDRIFPGGIRFRPAPVYLRVHAPIKPPKVSREFPYRKLTKIFSQEISEVMFSLVPNRVIPKDIYTKHPEQIGVFVDIDRTMYKYYSQQTFLKYLQKNDVISRLTTWKIIWHLILEKIGLLPHEVLMKRAYHFTDGLSEAALTNLAEPFFIEEIMPNLVHDLMVIIKDHEKRGHQIFFISEVISPLAVQFKKYFKARDIGVTTLEKKNGKYTGNLKELCVGDTKTQKVKQLAKKYNIDLSKSYAYGDSPTDIPMLKCVGHKIAVRPKPDLRHEAIMHGWHILD